jgi:hypothetical protein
MIPMKMNRYWLMLFGALAFAYSSHAQKVIPVEDRMLRDSIGENATRNTKQVGLLLAIQRMTKNTRDDVEATQRLQYDYQAFLKQTGSTASLRVSDAEAEQQATSLSASASAHLGAYSFADHLQEVYSEQTEPMTKSQVLYEQLIPYDEVQSGQTTVFTELPSFEAYQKTRQLNVSALEEMSQRRKLQLAQTYRQFAQQKVAQADELQQLLTTDQSFSMTEAERLETLRRVQNHLQSSQQLKAKADELIRQTSRPSFQKSQAINSFRQAQERQVIATTPVF